MNIGIETTPRQAKPDVEKVTAKEEAFELFSKQRPIHEIAAKINRAESTTVKYLIEFIQQENISDPAAWIDKKTSKNIQLLCCSTETLIVV